MDFLAYELKAAIVFALFYLFFRLLLSRETLHAFNRFMILGSCLLAMIIPFCEIKVQHPIVAASIDTLPAIKFIGENFGIDTHANTQEHFFSFENIALIIYAAGFITVLAGTLLSIMQILFIIKRGELISISNTGTTDSENKSYKIIITKEQVVPMSWMNYIIVSQNDYNTDNESILLHEKAHIMLKHSWDIIFIELFSAIQWFNPTVWLMRRDLRAIHEYEADEYVLDSGIDAKQYQLLLVKKAVGMRGNSVSNSLNHSNLKNRITMMLSKKSSMKSALKALYVLPLLGICLAANATDTVIESKGKNLPANANTTIVSQTDEKIYRPQELDVKAKFQGGDPSKTFTKWIWKNFNYPTDAEFNQTGGRVVVAFRIDTDGSVYNVKVTKGVSLSLDEEVIRVISSSPKWTPAYKDGKPVKTQYIIPITCNPKKSKISFK